MAFSSFLVPTESIFSSFFSVSSGGLAGELLSDISWSEMNWNKNLSPSLSSQLPEENLCSVCQTLGLREIILMNKTESLLNVNMQLCSLLCKF